MRSTAFRAISRTPPSILGGGTWATARRITIPLALPALLAGALVAFLQAMTLFGSPAILALPAGFHTMTTKIWSLFQYPPKPELAAAASLPLLVLTVMLLRAEHMILGRRGYSVRRRQDRAIRAWSGSAAGAGWRSALVLRRAAQPGVPALWRAAQRGVLAGRLAVRLVQQLHPAQHRVRVLRAVGDQARGQEHLRARRSSAATIGTVLAVVIAYLTARKAVAGHRALGFLATAPVAIPGIVLGVGLFLSYTRPPFVLYGTLWILLIAFVTIALPAAYQQLQSAFRVGPSRPRGRQPHPRRDAAAAARATSPRRCCAPA